MTSQSGTPLSDGNVHALLIEKDGRLVYEEYFTGEDESLGDDLGRVTFGRGGSTAGR